MKVWGWEREAENNISRGFLFLNPILPAEFHTGNKNLSRVSGERIEETFDRLDEKEMEEGAFLSPDKFYHSVKISSHNPPVLTVPLANDTNMGRFM